MDLLEQNRTHHVAQGAMELLPNYFGWIYGKFSDHISGQVVELGCGAGVGIQFYLYNVDKIYAVDHNPELLRKVDEKFHDEKVKTIQADLLDDWHELAGIEADTVIMMDVLEHFKDDKQFLRQAAALLRSGGRLVVKVPAQSALYSDIDRASGHFRRYDKADLQALASAVGLHVRMVKRMNPLGGLAYRFKKRSSTSFSKTFSPQQLKTINAAIPIIRLGDYVPLLPGLSLICVMEKSGSA